MLSFVHRSGSSAFTSVTLVLALPMQCAVPVSDVY